MFRNIETVTKYLVVLIIVFFQGFCFVNLILYKEVIKFSVTLSFALNKSKIYAVVTGNEHLRIKKDREQLYL